jgi:uncharacterized protein (TIGR03437 family)
MKPVSPGIVCLLAAVAFASDCARTSVGFIPLNDPFARSYRTVRLGLYPDGSNRRPAAHDALGLRMAAEVAPRDAAGAIDRSNGRIVLLSVGMSNTTQEFSVFRARARQDPEINPRLVIVDGAQGGFAAERILADPAAYWGTVEARLAAAGVTAAQVQAAWIKLANIAPALPFPEDARKLQADIRAVVQSLRPRFPNLRLAYLSSRIYAGYASTNLNPEPYAYQSGFAVKWLVEEQIRSDVALSVESGRAPWLAWGPFLWADGIQARADGLAWYCSDLAEDGTHPSEAGREKVAALLADFFKTDSTARGWFVRPPAGPVPTPAPAAVVNAASGAPEVAWGAIASIYGRDLAGAARAAGALPLPASLAGASVEVGGELAPVYYVSPGQINFVLPPAAEAAGVVVVREGGRSAPLALEMSVYAPGIFTLDGRPNGPAAARHAGGRIVSPQTPALRGETIELYATGIGVRHPLSLRPEIMPMVEIGGARAEVVYYGPAPGWPGLSQFNVVIPREALAGDAVPVEIRFGSAASNRATLAVGAGSYRPAVPRAYRKASGDATLSSTE